jgi:hypothetical protein
MADSRKMIRVFLASPGDLQDERRSAKVVVDEFNKLWADDLGYHVELVGWEDTISQYGRPQGTINQDLARCELVIGMMWKRWGTPPSKTGPFTSGFEEEFETSLANRRNLGRPELALLFKAVDKELLRDPGEELKKVLAFKERIIAAKEILYETYDGLGEFEGKIRACITAYVQRLRGVEAQKLSNETQATPLEAKVSGNEEAKPPRATTIADTAANFIKRFVTAATASEDENDDYTAVGIARFRLLATTVHKQGNDETEIGAHDSNLLFTHRSGLDLDRREQSGLVRSGVAHFDSENVPLWHWYASIDGFERKVLSFYSIANDTDHLHSNALKAMQLIEEPLPNLAKLPRHIFARNWFKETAASSLKSAALAYLSDCGLPEDLPAIRNELDQGDYQTRSASIHAIISINSREGREQAIKELYELQPDTVDRQLLISIFGNDASIAEKLLVEGTQHRCALVRRITAGILAKRGQLPTSEAERLLSDSDEHVRYVAINSLVKGGRTFSDEQAKAALVRQIGGMLGGSAGDKQLARFKQATLGKKTDAELEALSASASIFDRDAKLALLKRHFARKKDELVHLIEDEFKDDFGKSLADMVARYGEENQVVKETKGLEAFVRKGFTRRALDIVSGAGAAEHLNLVRNAIKNDFIDYSPLDLDFLKKHGEWQDIPLIIAATKKNESGISFLRSE